MQATAIRKEHNTPGEGWGRHVTTAGSRLPAQPAPCSWKTQGQDVCGQTHSPGTHQDLATSGQPYRFFFPAVQGVRMVHAGLTRHCMFIQRRHVMAAAHGHGRGGRKQSRGKLARRTRWRSRPQEKGGPQFKGSRVPSLAV